MDESQQHLREHLETSPTLRLVSVAGHVLGQRFGRIFGEQDGLSPSGAAVLNVIGWAGRGREHEIAPGRITHADLARRCMITPATLTGVVNTLAKAGYLRRERDEDDRRVVWLVLTEAGTERVRQLREQIRQIAAPIHAALDPEHEAVIRDFLMDLICGLSTENAFFPPTGPMMFAHGHPENGHPPGGPPDTGRAAQSGECGAESDPAHDPAHDPSHRHVSARQPVSAPHQSPGAHSGDDRQFDAMTSSPRAADRPAHRKEPLC